MPDNIANLASYVEKFSDLRLLCVGDMMLDTFVYGKAGRLSPEAPVPVLQKQRENSMPGGVGNVVTNLCTLGCQTSLISVVGQDVEGDLLCRTLAQQGSNVRLLLQQQNYCTTVKTRFVAGGHHLLRVDREEKLHLPDDALASLLKQVESHIRNIDLVLLSDYGKGLFDERFTPAIIRICQQHGCKVIVDPKRIDYTIYQGATVVKPNLKEFQGVTGRTFNPRAADFQQEAVAAGREVCRRYGVQNLLVTLSEHGMMYIPGDEAEQPVWIPTEAQEVFDVSGAGDTSLAALGASLAAGAPMQAAMRIANAASGIVVGKFGTASVTGTELSQKLGQKHNSGLVTAEEAVEIIAKLRAQGKIIGFTNGCFDLLHPGHLQSFRNARNLCDVLFVGLNSDDSVRRLKGPSRPVNNQESRAAMLTGLKAVDYVVIFDEDSALPLLQKLRPDVIAKEGYPLEKWRGGQFVVSYGGRAVELPRVEGFSSTSIINKLNQ